MEYGTNDADTCEVNQWAVGDLLIGHGFDDVSIIKITAIGEERVLARKMYHNGKRYHADESLWGLKERTWRKLGFFERANLFLEQVKGMFT